MKLGVLTNLLGSVSLEEALKYFSSFSYALVKQLPHPTRLMLIQSVSRIASPIVNNFLIFFIVLLLYDMFF